jgi:cell division protein ZapB
MDVELFSRLEKKVDALLASYARLKHESLLLEEENRRLIEERSGVRNRIDAILEKLEGIEDR